MAKEIFYSSIADLSARIQSRDVSSREVTTGLLERIDSLDGDLGAFCTVTPQEALAQADAADSDIRRGNIKGPLQGVPVAIKDVFWTKGIATAAGTKVHAGFVPREDATAVARLKAAGAVILGKTHMTEAATLDYHPDMRAVKHFEDAALWPGASSSGSGVAVAAGMCFSALGSDTGGSIRYPAACSGVTGFKPSWGAVSRFGCFEHAPTFDHYGPLARSAVDCQLVFDAICGADAKDPTTEGLSLRSVRELPDDSDIIIGIDSGILASIDTETADAINAASRSLEAAGVRRVEEAFPQDDALLDMAIPLVMAETAYVHRETYLAKAALYGPVIKDMLRAGTECNPVDLGRGMILREQYRTRIAALFKRVDAFILPVMSHAAPTLEEYEASISEDFGRIGRFMFPANLAGLPAVVFPCGKSASGRYISLQVIGPRGDDNLVLRLAKIIQEA